MVKYIVVVICSAYILKSAADKFNIIKQIAKNVNDLCFIDSILNFIMEIVFQSIIYDKMLERNTTTWEENDF